MSQSDHTASGQALGYIYQFQRATYRLLTAGLETISVGVEHLDDVSVHLADGTSVREQDKATIGGGSPFTDRSVALWKTLSIWVQAVLDVPSTLESTEFHLVTNGRMTDSSLARQMAAADTIEAATPIATALLGMVPELREDLQPFGAVVAQAPDGILARLVARVFAFDRLSQRFGGSLENIQALKLLGSKQREMIFDSASGWVRRRILENAQAGVPTAVARVDFDRELQAFARELAAAPLTMVCEVPESDLEPSRYGTSGFFRQLDWIEVDVGFIRQSVIHFVQARAMRARWTDSSLVSEQALRTHQDDLLLVWNLVVRRGAMRTYPNPITQGQDRLYETLDYDSSLEGQLLPKAVTAGNFHRLADFDEGAPPRIGWHPDFLLLAKTPGKP